MGVIPWPFDGSIPGFFAYKVQESFELPGGDYRGQVYGRTIPLTQGKRVIVGAPIWAGTVTADTQYTSVGGGDITTTDGMWSYSMQFDRQYYRSFACAFGYNLAPEGDFQAPMVLRIWSNGILIYDARDPSAAASKQPRLNWTFYPGSETQLPDATIAADKGAANTPAFLGMMYIVFRDFMIGEIDMPEDIVGLSGVDEALALGVATFEDAKNGKWPTPAEVASLPDIRIEVADGFETTLSSERFGDLDDALTHNSSTTGMAIDWRDRNAITFTNGPGGHDERYVTLWDMQGRAMLDQQLITGNVGGAPYGSLEGTQDDTSACMGWDPVSDIIFTLVGGGNASPFVTINRATGAIVGEMGEGGVFAPRDEDGNHPDVTGKDWLKIPYATSGAMYWFSDGRNTKPVFAMGGFLNSSLHCWMGVVTPIDDTGALPAQLPNAGTIGLTGEDPNGVQHISAVPMLYYIQSSGGTSSQDVCFVVGNGVELHIVYTKTRQGANEEWISEIITYTNFGTLITGGRVRAFLFDNTGMVVLYEAGSVSYARRYAMSLLNTSGAQEIAPGFRGALPVIGEMLYDVEILDFTSDLRDTGMNSSWCMGSNTFYYLGSLGTVVALDLNSGSARVTATAAGGEPIPGNYAFDATTGSWYGIGDVSLSSAIEGFYRFDVRDASTNEPATIGEYAEWLALKAGYDEADIEVDPSLDDEVVGMILDVEYPFQVLFNDLGRLYDFAYYISEGKIKFQKFNRNPVKASSILTWAGNPADNDTVTIGSTVYTFKTVMTLPFHVQIGANAIATKSSLTKAINLNGVAGTDYGVGTTINSFVTANDLSATQLGVTAIHGGSGGNLIATQETSSVLSWTGITLAGGEDAATGDPIDIHDMAPISEGGAGDSEVLITTLSQISEVPNTIKVTFFDLGLGYQWSNVIVTGDTLTQTPQANGGEELKTPVVMTDSEAYRRASKLSFKAMEQTITQELRLPWRYLAYEPTDVIRVSIGDYTYIIKMDEITLNGDMSLSIGGMNFATQDNITIPDMPERPEDQIGIGTADSRVVIIDGPIFTPVNGSFTDNFSLQTGLRSAGQPNFSTAAIHYRKIGEETVYHLYNTAADIPAGIALTTLPATTHPWHTDTETVFRVASRSIKETHLQSLSYADYLEGKNMLVVGRPGRWEYIYFQNAEFVSASTIEFTNIARGRRGTEVNTDNHEVGDEVYIVRATGEDFEAIPREQLLPVALVGEEFEYRSWGLPLEHEAEFVYFTFAGYSLYPWAPHLVKATLEVGDDVEITWVRRDRLSIHDWVTEDTELNEATEEYELDIMDGSSVVRTVTGLATPEYLYSAADQATDGFTPPLTEIKVRVFQVGALGRGFMKEATVNVE